MDDYDLFEQLAESLNTEEMQNKVKNEFGTVKSFYNKYYNGERYKNLLNQNLKDRKLTYEQRYSPDEVDLHKRLRTTGSSADRNIIKFGLMDLIPSKYSFTEPWDIGSILSHEFGHTMQNALYFTDSNDNEFKGLHSEQGANSRPYKFGYYDSFPELYTLHSDWQKYYNESDDETKKLLDKDPTYGLTYNLNHDIISYENKSDLDAILYNADKYGIFDVTDPNYKVTIEDINKLLLVMPEGFRTFKYYKPEQIATFLNTIAQNNNQNNYKDMYYAKQGIKLIPKKRFIK